MIKKALCALFLLLAVSATISAQTMKVATYNVRYDNKQDTANAWLRRLPHLTNLIRFQDFDLFGTQEVLYTQLQDMTSKLPGYAYIGVGRDDGKQAGEYSAIFYKQDRYKLLKQGTFWLAPNTTAPVKGWDAALPRVCTWGQFQEKTTGFTFYLFNTHFDHVGVQARKESAKLILARIKEMAGASPAILTGDLNVDQRNESYTLLSTSGTLRDAYQTAAVVYAPNGTFNDFKATTKTDARIDHIFLSPAFTATRYGILTDTYGGGKTPSDHYPVAIEVRYSVKK
ncbi:endonuclease/exonuclease/phosphatase family protein [Hymenobacter sp. BT186]|uniref:Endonuclease/exonuclease/phosphatase family protein n=1 Tax=Hymenobacter telluris TaxID=2816474 RepID=A0A939EUS0_9BACT|nr:endonuclease/exonuclease/phosphatase family protein [Hymenobacter telluris]MBO0358214.1 endonuclease/exonuclease/phosphatase family protein [Hymenobacter telluris]MBW3374240.1 endonuclease/exonuclease/phosphatase family protein [Hymenobacter norwichensis]